MLYRTSCYKAIPILLSVCALLSSCKENTVIRTDVVPAVDNITVFGTDTLTLLTKTVKDDSVISNLYNGGAYMGAGHISGDPVFGKTAASFYFQVRPPQDNYSLDQTVYKIDSAVLVLPYSGVAFGDTTNSAGKQIFKAYRMTEKIYYDSIYYANTPAKNINPSPIATATVDIPALIHSYQDSTLVGGVKRAPHLRMRLDNDVLKNLVDNFGTSNYANTSSFLDFFNGIYISTETGGNTIPYFKLQGDDNFSRAGMVMYYHTINSGGAITDTLSVGYPFDATATATKTGFLNSVSRDYTGTLANTLFSSTAATDNTILLQNLPGASIDIRIPNVKNLPRCIVNKAELVITQISSPLDAIFETPARIYPEVINEGGARIRIADRNPVSSSSPLIFIDGTRRSVNLGGAIVNQYVLNFPRELQNAIVEQRKELRLRISGTQTFVGAFRLTAAGSSYSQPQYRVKLNVVYTKL